jgi:hypothetical protein
MVTIIKKGTSKEKIFELLERHSKQRRKQIDLKKYCGVIRIKEDALKLQKLWRDEWE